jgi:hypothetical protein
MITAERFIAPSYDRPSWLAARTGGVTATEVAKAATPAGFAEAVLARTNPTPIESNGYMQFGTDHEEWIALEVKRQFGILPNLWLIAAEDNPRFMATPDGLSLDHMRVSEIKTGGKEPKSIPIVHRRQMQFQLYCTGATSGVYAFMLRAEVNGVFVPAWMTPKFWELERDDTMIADLLEVADRLLETTERIAA